MWQETEALSKKMIFDVVPGFHWPTEHGLFFIFWSSSTFLLCHGRFSPVRPKCVKILYYYVVLIMTIARRKKNRYPRPTRLSNRFEFIQVELISLLGRSKVHSHHHASTYTYPCSPFRVGQCRSLCRFAPRRHAHTNRQQRQCGKCMEGQVYIYLGWCWWSALDGKEGQERRAGRKTGEQRFQAPFSIESVHVICLSHSLYLCG